MVPTIYPGDRVSVTSPGELKLGDIVLVDGPRLHRVVNIDRRKSNIITQGDALQEPDPMVGMAQVTAVVSHISPVWSARIRFHVQGSLFRRIRNYANSMKNRNSRIHTLCLRLSQKRCKAMDIK